MKVLVEKMNVTGLDLAKYSKGQLATASSDDIASKFKKVSFENRFSCANSGWSMRKDS